MTSDSLKVGYQKWLWILVISDLLLVLLLAWPSLIFADELLKLINWRVLATALVPVLVLLLVNILPDKMKTMLVYWKPYGWLPGSEVFTNFAVKDARGDMETLAKNVGLLPLEPRKQNERWYQLYKMVDDRTEVVNAHRTFLMYRDMAVLSLAFGGLSSLLLYVADVPKGVAWAAVLLFLAQYILTSLSARWSGIRFVCNVVALHSASAINKAKPVRQTVKPTARQL